MQLVNKEDSVMLSELTSEDLTPSDCILLWKAVVRQVVLDVELLISQAKQQQAKLGFVAQDKQDQMLEIMTEIEDEHFHDCCENAELEVTRVRSHVADIIEQSGFQLLPFGNPVRHTESGRCLKAA